MPEDIPDVLRASLGPALARFDEAVGALRTRVIRASRIELPPVEPPDPKLLEEAAARPDAPPQLKAVARAVREGRTSWAEVLSGHGLDVPEIRDLISASGPRMAEKIAEAEAAEAAGAAAAPPASPPVPPRRPRPDDWDDDDLGNQTYLY